MNKLIVETKSLDETRIIDLILLRTSRVHLTVAASQTCGWKKYESVISAVTGVMTVDYAAKLAIVQAPVKNTTPQKKMSRVR